MRREAVRVRRDARRDRLVLEDLVDGAEDIVARPERMLELAKDEAETAVEMRALEVPAHFGELLRRRVLERIDRLFFVADREDRTRYVARAGAGGEFGNQPLHNLPLLVA